MEKQLEKLRSGSVKDLMQDQEGQLYFSFSDRYSIFDWGEMPDNITEKGMALSYFAQAFFSILESPDLWTKWSMGLGHYPYINQDIIRDLSQSGLKTHMISKRKSVWKEGLLPIKAFEILKPSINQTTQGEEYDYSSYESRPTSTLVPLEVIFRFGAPKGSSLFKRINNDRYREEIGLEIIPKEGDLFEKPVIEFSTKLESEDRMLTYSEAKKIARLSDAEFNKLLDLTKILALRCKSIFREGKVFLWDGKFEFAFGEQNENGDREFIIIDSIGPDELRLSSQGIPLSKQNLRDCYVNSSWHGRVEQSKKTAKDKGLLNWKDYYYQTFPNEEPPRLENKQIELYSNMYKALANTLAISLEDNKPFPNAVELLDVVNQISESKNG
ncbi:MAG: hypothetical protein GY909_13125 [Oligoflexia bacterium]|nr:hypothetical protein [Oligoflexia bacterium]